jgi:hypothetical protein
MNPMGSDAGRGDRRACDAVMIGNATRDHPATPEMGMAVQARVGCPVVPVNGWLWVATSNGSV